MIPGGGGAGSVRHVWGRMRGNVPQQVVENEEAREHGNRPLGRSPALRGNEDDNKWGRRRPRKGRKRRGGKSRRRSGKRRRRRSGTGRECDGNEKEEGRIGRGAAEEEDAERGTGGAIGGRKRQEKEE